ncbi:hypothetical protein [Chryseobacterium oryctis]|uniref:Immunity protein 22 n=1 Tax=Chryseobacterium oryctis TaxID=2952618 RepID=A0ABT3HMY5_9FLAO|nr:hypothetical protein [Chryseobacterium oryctis]MCW3161145.1 hypothetical protein [Chryseobacterium oryctis]
MKESVPKTKIELKNWMESNCYDFRGYSIAGNSISEGFGIEENESSYIWYYTEYGKKENLKYFKLESEIIEYAFNHIKADKWAKANCIGFGTDKNESIKLTEILKNMKIDYFQDQIPFTDEPIFRTFVFGCDIKKVSFLKNEYYHSYN